MMEAVRLELTLYFQRNPYARETAESLSVRIGRPVALVESILARLEAQTIIERQGPFYRYRSPYLHPLSQNGLE